MGIMASQNIVSHPLTRRMKIGSPCTDAHRLFIVAMMMSPLALRARVVAFVAVTRLCVMLGRLSDIAA
jgi:hypothetical protein